jgi:succinate-acetate transporter protein
VDKENEREYLIPASCFEIFESKFIFFGKFWLKIFYSFSFPPGKYRQITGTLNKATAVRTYIALYPFFTHHIVSHDFIICSTEHWLTNEEYM